MCYTGNNKQSFSDDAKGVVLVKKVEDRKIKIVALAICLAGTICASMLMYGFYHGRTVDKICTLIEDRKTDQAIRAINGIWSIDGERTYGGTMLQTACRMGNVEVIRHLLEKGANPHREKGWMTPLECYCANNFGGDDMEAVKLLVEYGADPAVFASSPSTFLLAWQFSWRAYDRKKVVSQEILFLLEHGAPMVFEGRSLLHVAARTDEEELFEVLLDTEEGRKCLSMKDKDGYTPWDIAVQNGSTEVQALILTAEQE